MDKVLFLRMLFLFLFIWGPTCIQAARKVRVEDIIAETKMRLADEFQKRTDDGNPPGLEEYLDLPKEENLVNLTSKLTPKNVLKTKFIQQFEDIPVFGSNITAAVNKETGKPTEEVTGYLMKGVKEDIQNTEHKITEEEALEIARKHHKHTTVGREKTELKIFLKDKAAHLVFFVQYLAEDNNKMTGPLTVVDSKNGKVLQSWETVYTAHKSLQGYGGNTHIGRLNFTGVAGQLNKLNLTVDSENNTLCLMKNEDFRVIDLRGRSLSSFFSRLRFKSRSRNIPTVTVNCNVEPIPNRVVAEAYNVINDVYFFSYHTFKMFQKFNLSIHYNDMEMWVNFRDRTGGNAGVFGEILYVSNGGPEVYPMTSYGDIIAHELGHTFTASNSLLMYFSESGAMNEAFSDMVGATFHNYIYGQNNWRCGENLLKDNTPALRYMDDPTEDGISIDHYDNYNELLDVHFTSGIYNKAFYNLATTPGWNITRAFEIFSSANVLYWGSMSTMAEGACGVVTAAGDSGYNQTDVTTAFSNVGVVCNAQEA